MPPNARAQLFFLFVFSCFFPRIIGVPCDVQTLEVGAVLGSVPSVSYRQCDDFCAITSNGSAVDGIAFVGPTIELPGGMEELQRRQNGHFAESPCSKRLICMTTKQEYWLVPQYHSFFWYFFYHWVYEIDPKTHKPSGTIKGHLYAKSAGPFSLESIIYNANNDTSVTAELYFTFYSYIDPAQKAVTPRVEFELGWHETFQVDEAHLDDNGFFSRATYYNKEGSKFLMGNIRYFFEAVTH